MKPLTRLDYEHSGAIECAPCLFAVPPEWRPQLRLRPAMQEMLGLKPTNQKKTVERNSADGFEVRMTTRNSDSLQSFRAADFAAFVVARRLRISKQLARAVCELEAIGVG